MDFGETGTGRFRYLRIYSPTRALRASRRLCSRVDGDGDEDAGVLGVVGTKNDDVKGAKEMKPVYR